MSRSEIHTTVRIVDEKADYILKRWNGSISKYLNYSIPRDMNIIKNNRKKNFFESFSRNIVMLGLGAIFVLFSFSIDNLLGKIMVFLLGVFFVISSLYSVFMEVLGRWKTL